MQESKKNWDITNIVKSYFLSGHLRKILKKDKIGEIFCFKRKKFFSDSRDSCILRKKVMS